MLYQEGDWMFALAYPTQIKINDVNRIFLLVNLKLWFQNQSEFEILKKNPDPQC